MRLYIICYIREFKSLENAKNCLIGDLRFWFVLVSRLYNEC